MAATDSAGICTDQCMDDNLTNCIQCLLCQKTFHGECVGLSRKPAESVQFYCDSCKNMPSRIDQILLIVKQTNEELTRQVRLLTAEVNSIKEMNMSLKKENENLVKEISTLSLNSQKSNWQGFREKEKTIQHKELVLSDSMLKFVDKDKLDDTSLVCIPDADIARITKELDAPKYHGTQLDKIVVMVCTNDMNKEEDCVDTMLGKYGTLIDKAKSIASNVILSSICPRLDDLSDLVEPINSALTNLCTEKECSLICHRNSFTLADGSVNDGYLLNSRGPYLTKSGLNKVARNLKLNIKKDVNDISIAHHNRAKSNTFRSEGGNRNSRPSVPGVRMNNRGCVLCNEGGHNAANCRHREWGPVVCRACHLPGHKAKHHTQSPN